VAIAVAVGRGRTAAARMAAFGRIAGITGVGTSVGGRVTTDRAFAAEARLAEEIVGTIPQLPPKNNATPTTAKTRIAATKTEPWRESARDAREFRK
jgi:hypothetical protein